MKYKAFGKINLGLHILDKRPDGYHNIETIFTRIALYDELTIEPTNSEVIVTTSDPKIPENESNICWKAVRLLQKAMNVRNGAKIHIIKNIPSGAGLGGGSSDAAIVLTHLPDIWNTELPKEKLDEIALRLGSDVPFFLKSSTCYGSRRGEYLEEISLSHPYWTVVATPPIHVPTPWAYMTLAEQRNGTVPPRRSMKEALDSNDFKALLTNDFEDIVIDHFPAIGTLRQHLLQSGAEHVLLSGSGSSVFGLFSERKIAEQCIATLQNDHVTSLTPPRFTVN